MLTQNKSYTNKIFNGFPIKNWRTQIERIIAEKSEKFDKKTYNYLKNPLYLLNQCSQYVKYIFIGKPIKIFCGELP